MENRIKKFRTILNNEPLVFTRGNSDLVKDTSLNKNGGTIFFGIGLMTNKQLSENVPFDVLSMFFFSELLRKKLQLKKVIILIADTHAISNDLFQVDEINLVSKKTLETVNKIIRNFAFNDFEVILASKFQGTDKFQEILSKIPKMNNEYLRLEIADVMWLKSMFDLKIKIGWSLTEKFVAEGNDERLFDTKITTLCPDISLIHLKPGHTLDKVRPRVSPYLSIAGENRLLLKQGENVQDKLDHAREFWNDPSLGGAIGNFLDIVRLFEKLQGKLPFQTLEEKIQFLVNKAVA